MSDPIPKSEVPDDVGRNDPCPCGSGRKYKKCCQRIHRVQKEAAKRSRGVQDLVDETVGPWQMYKLLHQVQDNNMTSLAYDMTHDEGPYRANFGSRESYLEAVTDGRENFVARDGWDLRRIRHDGPDVYLLLAAGFTNPQASTASIEIVHLRPNEYDAERSLRDVEHPGWRIWDVQRVEHDKDALEDGDVNFQMFDVEWAPAWTAPDVEVPGEEVEEPAEESQKLADAD